MAGNLVCSVCTEQEDHLLTNVEITPITWPFFLSCLSVWCVAVNARWKTDLLLLLNTAFAFDQQLHEEGLKTMLRVSGLGSGNAWNQIHSGPDTYNWAGLDQEVAQAIQVWGPGTQFTYNPTLCTFNTAELDDHGISIEPWQMQAAN